MRIDIITCLPKLLQGSFSDSILKGHRTNNWQALLFMTSGSTPPTSTKPWTTTPLAGAGMVMMVEPIDRCISHLKGQRSYDEIIYLSPDGQPLTQSLANQLSLKQNLILLCGHYKGVDERVREHLITREISIGDYVLSGGELAAAVLSDSIIRLIPGIV